MRFVVGRASRTLAAAVLCGVVAVPALVHASSAIQNVDLMARWTAATIVNYRVIAEFSGAALLVEADGIRGHGTVSDRFEVEFDWNQTDYMMIGKPIIRNFPSKLIALPTTGCPITVTGAFEHATVLELRNADALRMANAVEADVQRQLPAGTVSSTTDVGPCALVRQSAARTVKHQLSVPATPGMMFGLPSGQVGFEHNGKSFVIRAASTTDKGWTYTVTPTIVK